MDEQIPLLHEASVHVFRVALDVTSGTALPVLRGLLGRDEEERAGRFHFERDRRRWIVCRMALRTLLGAHLSVAPEALTFVAGDFGKPALGPPWSEAGIQFNVSHCGETALIAVARGREVGIDVEAIRAEPDWESIADWCLSASERSMIRDTPPALRQQLFFRFWVGKEAWLKASGVGLQESPSQTIVPAALVRGDVPSVTVAPFLLYRLDERLGGDDPAIAATLAVTAEDAELLNVLLFTVDPEGILLRSW